MANYNLRADVGHFSVFGGDATLSRSRFVGRKGELAWLRELFGVRSSWHKPIIVAGAAGVGKTALVQTALLPSNSEHRWDDWAPLWFSGLSQQDVMSGLEDYIERLYQEGRTQGVPYPRHNIVVLDDVDALSDRDLERAVDRLYNLKRVRTVVLITRRIARIRNAELIRLKALDTNEAGQLLHDLIQNELSPDIIEQAIQSTHGYPLAISILAQLLGKGDASALNNVLNGPLYDVQQVVLPSTDIVAVAAPRIVTATEGIVERLRACPESIYDLSPREFEELLAELLVGMGWEVELTRQTRDGGKDLLAYYPTEMGRILCLVEAKKYRRDRKIGVGLVRNLYGTLCDHQASSAVLVTTSSFSPDAREFQQKHEHRLSLRDYADLVQWIQRHKRGGDTG